MLQDEGRRELSKLRYEHAEECLRAAEALYQADDLKGAANRSYIDGASGFLEAVKAFLSD